MFVFGQLMQHSVLFLVSRQHSSSSQHERLFDVLTIFGETFVRRCLVVFPDVESVGKTRELYDET